MGSDLYSVAVIEKRNRTVVFDVLCVHPDVLQVLDDPGFALMLLHGEAPSGSPLATEVSLDDVMSQAWAGQYAKGFIADAKADQVQNPPPPGADSDHPYWEGEWLRWRLTVEVTDPAWTQHIEAGQTWPSRAFTPAWSYQAHPPIAWSPDKIEADPEGMFVWVPRECFCRNLDAWASLPRLLEMPAWPASRYTTTGDTSGPLDEGWVGVPVLARSRYGHDELGVVGAVDDPGAPLIVHMGMGSYGMSRSGLDRIGRLVPLQSSRPGERLDYRTVLSRASITLTEARCDGAVARITLQVPPDGRAVPVQTASDALDVLLAPLWRSFDEELASVDSPLAAALIADGVSLQLETHRRLKEVLPLVALRYIEDFTLHAGPTSPAPDLDAMTHAGARAALSAPWPSVTLTLRVTDPRWLAHLAAAVGPFPIRDRPLPAPLQGEPPTAEGPPPEPDTRLVMWRDGRFRETWIGERRGSVTLEWSGRREREDRKEASTEHASPEAADKWLLAEAKKREKKNYRRLPAASDVADAVARRLGLRLGATRPVQIVEASDPAESVEDTRRFRAGDHVTGVGVLGSSTYVRVVAVEELAAALEGLGGQVYVWYHRPASGTSTSVSLRL